MTDAAGDDRGLVLLVDGYSLVHRAFFALPPLRNAEGQPTNAVYGFLNMLLKLLGAEGPTHAVVAFDASGPTFRDEMYAEYKAHRQETPDDLRSQFELTREALAALRVPVVEEQGYEADDVIGTLARRARGEGHRVLMVTGDRDLLQLVEAGVHALITRRGISDLRTYDRESLDTEYGLEPAQLVDVKALMGDASDNIPGVPGVGEKTAVKLVREFGSLEGVLENVERVGGKKLPENLRRYAEVARQSRRLAAIVTDAPVEVAWEDCRRRDPDAARARELFERLEFRSLLDRLGVDRRPAVSDAEGPAPQVLRGPGELGPVREAVDAAPRIAVTYRLYGADARHRPVACLALAAGGRAWALLCDAGEAAPDADAAPDDAAAGDALPEAAALELFAAAVARAARGEAQLIVHDVKPLLRRCLRAGVWERCPAVFSGDGGTPVFDTAIAAYLLDPARTAYRVRDLVRQYLDRDAPEPEDLTSAKGRRAGPAPWGDADPGEAGGVLGRQAALLEELARRLEAEIAGQGMGRLFHEIEAPLTEVLATMEHAGVRVDRQALAAIGEDLTRRIEALAAQIHELAGTEFNINSTRQLGQVLFERLELPVIKRTKTGYSTDADVLEQLAAEHPIAAKVLEHRSLVKLMGTYVDGLVEEIEEDGRIHSTFQQTVAATGRLASISPNLQNIPIREESGRQLRRAFTAAPGQRLLAADYSQVELRVLAHVSGDERMLEAFRRDDDIHARTAAEVFGVPLDEVSRKMRSMAKAVNFGIVYGISDFGLARQLGIARAEAKRFIDRYFERYAGVRRYLDEAVRQAREHGYVRTMFGRIRYLPDIKSRIFHRRSFAERTAMNTPIQGAAADVIKAAMVRVHRRLRAEERSAPLILQVHDELILEVPEDELEAAAALVSQEMSRGTDLDVPLLVETRAGRDWFDMEALEPPDA